MGILNLKYKTAYKYIKKQLINTSNLEINKKNEINKIGIIADLNLFKTYDFTKKLCEQFGVDKNAVKVILFEDLKNDIALPEYHTFSEKSFAMYGNIKALKLTKFVNTPFDILINYCAVDNIYGQVAVCKSKAKLKASFESVYANFYHISIQVPRNKIDAFNNELIKYLQILNLLK